MANLEERGLPKVRGDAAAIFAEMRGRGVDPVLCGALDEYGENGSAIAEIVAEDHPDFVLLVGVPHAVVPEALQGITVFSVTNGPWQVAPRKEEGQSVWLVWNARQPTTLGVHESVESECGAVRRSVA